MDRRSLPVGVHLLAGLFLALAVPVWVIGDATAWQVMLPLYPAVMLESTAYLDTQPETFRDDER